MCLSSSMLQSILHQSVTSDRVSTTPGNPGNLLEFVWSSWKFLCKMSMIDCIGFQSWWNWVPDRLFKKLVALFIFATAPMLCISCFCSIFRQTSKFGTLHSRPKQCKHVLDFSWNLSKILLEICSVKFVDTLSEDKRGTSGQISWKRSVI